MEKSWVSDIKLNDTILTASIFSRNFHQTYKIDIQIIKTQKR